MDEILKLVDILTIEVNPHHKDRESVANYLTRMNQHNEMSARTFMEMHKARTLVRIEARTDRERLTVYATTVNKAITKILNKLENASIKAKST